MSVNPIWEEIYSSGHSQKYPWDLVVSFVYRNYPREKCKSDVRILEVGFGSGSNLYFAAQEGFSVAGVEGSPTAVEFAKSRFEDNGLQGDLCIGDFLSLPFSSETFNLAIDRGSLCCVSKNDQKVAITEIHRCLRKGGRFLYTGYTDSHSSMRSGITDEDGLTSNISAGTLTGVGSIAFISRSDIDEFFSQGWQLLSVQRREYIDMLNPLGGIHSEWVVIAEKVYV